MLSSIEILAFVRVHSGHVLLSMRWHVGVYGPIYRMLSTSYFMIPYK